MKHVELPASLRELFADSELVKLHGDQIWSNERKLQRENEDIRKLCSGNFEPRGSADLHNWPDEYVFFASAEGPPYYFVDASADDPTVFSVLDVCNPAIVEGDSPSPLAWALESGAVDDTDVESPRIRELVLQHRSAEVPRRCPRDHVSHFRETLEHYATSPLGFEARNAPLIALSLAVVTALVVVFLTVGRWDWVVGGIGYCMVAGVLAEAGINKFQAEAIELLESDEKGRAFLRESVARPVASRRLDRWSSLGIGMLFAIPAVMALGFVALIGFLLYVIVMFIWAMWVLVFNSP